MPVDQELLDELIKEVRINGEKAMDQLRVAHMEQVKLAQMHARERIDELVKQNDGLLGAVGRLQREKEEAVKKLDTMEDERRRVEHEIEMKIHELNAQQDRQREDLDKERAGYKAEIAALKAKLKKQGKK